MLAEEADEVAEHASLTEVGARPLAAVPGAGSGVASTVESAAAPASEELVEVEFEGTVIVTVPVRVASTAVGRELADGAAAAVAGGGGPGRELPAGHAGDRAQRVRPDRHRG